MRAPATLVGLCCLGPLLSLAACSDGGGGGDPEQPGMLPNLAGAGQGAPSGAGAAGAPAGSVGVAGYDRPPGMLIGRGMAAGGEGGDGMGGSSTTGEDPTDIEVPLFEPTPPALEGPPCSGCIEISAVIDDPNQSNDFAIDVGGVQVTRVVWSILIPFNSDQLFIRSVVDGNDGAYTMLSANNFKDLNTPVEFVHAFSGTANRVGLRIGSAGAWTGNQRMSIFVDSVTLEGAAASANRTFDVDAQGMSSRTAERDPMVLFHP